MYFITIDCGTTNSRVYIVDEEGNIHSKAAKHVGVRNTSMTGSRDCLEEGLRETVSEAVAQSGIDRREFRAILSSGMITSEIGLCEIPHLMAPCDMATLAANLTPVKNVRLTDFDIPVYFVRGIKNAMPEAVEDPFDLVGELDFMRGEEAQVAGLLARGKLELPTTLVVLSSHTKFIPIGERGEILGSLTTTSGQVHEAILKQTFVGKSVEQPEGAEEEPEGYFDPDIVAKAAQWIRRGGILRSMMLPRFLDVLLDTQWYQRKHFYESLIAAEDMLAIGQLDHFDPVFRKRFVFVGLPGRCRLYEFVVRQNLPDAEVRSISDAAEIDRLSIDGVLEIAKRAGIFDAQA
ncbi:MAG: hypothetical protein GX592_04190 [Clostridiales bacterium]|nr:hypothetical protein [Clostridiales bacterium]